MSNSLNAFLLFIILLIPESVYAVGDHINSRKQVIHLPDGNMDVYFEYPFSVIEQKKLLRWLQVSSHTITTLYGQFPVKQVEVHLYALYGANEPVPWGEVWKNGSYRVNFQVNPDFPLNDFIADWTAPHEFSHLFHPYPGGGNAWFGEGLASYYQNILRIRKKTLSEQQAWQKLIAGFQRGENQSKRDKMTLFQASQKMHSTGNYQHVYWGGAAYFLAVDIRLRQETQGRESLDTAWFKFKQCCLGSSNWSADKLIYKLDQLTGTSIFSQEYNKDLHDRSFPDYRSSLQQLGIQILKNKVILSDAVPSSKLRSKIVTANNLN